MTDGPHPDHAALYAEVRARIAALVREASPEQLDTVVGGTPKWSGRQLVAHLAGVACDVNAGRIGPPTEEWTDAHVAARSSRSLEEVFDEWEKEAPAIEAALAANPRMSFLLFDVATHEQDLRAALGRSGGDDSVAFDLTLQAMVAWLGRRLADADVPGLRIVSGNEEWEIGAGVPVATVRVDDRVELFRMVTGRRSVRQVTAYDWDGDPTPYVNHLNPFGPTREDDVLG